MSLVWGGPPRSVQGLTATLTKNGVHCEIVTTQGQRTGTDPIQVPGVDVHSFDTDFLGNHWTGHSVDLAEFIEEQVSRFDLVHIHEVWHYPCYVAWRSCRKHGIPYVVSLRDGMSAWSLRTKAVRKWIYRKLVQDRILASAAALHAITQTESEHLGALGYKSRKAIIPNGILVDPFMDFPDTSDFLAKYKALQGKRVVLFVGRIMKKKGLDILMRAFAAIADKFQDVALLIVGPDEGGNQSKLEKFLHKADLSHRVVFTGLLTGHDRLAAFGCAEIFVLPSHSEVGSRVVLEAMASKLPVILSEGCQFSEVAEYQAGYITKLDNTSLAETIDTLLSLDRDRLVRMGGNGQKLMLEKFSWERMAGQMLNLYNEIIDSPQSSAKSM